MTISCNAPFTADERKLIGTDTTTMMRVLTIDNHADSLVLRSLSAPLTERHIADRHFLTLKERMLLTVNDPDNQGVGIAAPQVGVRLQLIAVQRFDKEGEPFEFYVNPRIERYSTECQIGGEGCLSVPNMHGQVRRAAQIDLVYNDPATFELCHQTVEGFTAVIFQHEIDHLSGKLYTDRITLVDQSTTPSESESAQ